MFGLFALLMLVSAVALLAVILGIMGGMVYAVGYGIAHSRWLPSVLFCLTAVAVLAAAILWLNANDGWLPPAVGVLAAVLAGAWILVAASGSAEADTERRGDRDCVRSYARCLNPDTVDYDCSGGQGDGPSYVTGPFSVSGADPFDLDRDGDGIACGS